MRPTLFNLFKIVTHSSLPSPTLSFFHCILSSCNILHDFFFHCLSQLPPASRLEHQLYKNMVLFCSRNQPKILGECLAHSRYPVNIICINLWIDSLGRFTLCWLPAVGWALCNKRKLHHQAWPRMKVAPSERRTLPRKEKYSRCRQCQLDGDIIKEYSRAGKEI